MVKVRPFNSVEGRAVPCSRDRVGTKKVLFICTHNSVRSQMAEGLLNYMFVDRYQAFSAGVKPGCINPLAIDVMAEIGIDISHQRSKSIEEIMDDFYDTVVTVCESARESCPVDPGGAELLHHPFEDPSSFDGTPEEMADKFREVRDKIKEWLEMAFGPSSPRYLSRPSGIS
ncbi:MAG: arsenate reductase ArsC [Methanomassiliicoccales archaeon]|nr:arsenate reductase ArsC [Methanomassiliicoccales archaeon]